MCLCTQFYMCLIFLQRLASSISHRYTFNHVSHHHRHSRLGVATQNNNIIVYKTLCTHTHTRSNTLFFIRASEMRNKARGERTNERASKRMNSQKPNTRKTKRKTQTFDWKRKGILKAVNYMSKLLRKNMVH